VWWFGANGAAVGALDGLAFSLAGAAVGFAVFFVLWVFGTAGGGDVKLATAIAGWVGVKPFFFVLGVTLVVVTVLTVLRIGTKVVVGKPSQATGAPTRRGLGLSYALPLTVGVLALLALMVLPIQVRLAPAGG
jgi:Flp pilus assembly protein protease CpaA